MAIDFERRRTYIGGSDAAAILGMSRWKTELQVWMDKTGTAVTEESLPMWLGTKMEEIVAERFTIESGKKVRKVNDTIIHAKYPYLGANIDRKVEGEDAILECKTAGEFKAKEWQGSEIPQEYLIQVWHYLGVTGREKAYIACVVGNRQFVWKEINIIDDIVVGAKEDSTPITKKLKVVINEMEERLARWWEKYIIGGVMPDNISCADTDNLLALYPQSSGETIEIGDELDNMVEQVKSFEEDLKSLEGSIEQKKNEIKAILKEAEVGKGLQWQAKWSNQISNRFDTKSFEKENPELASKYRKESSTRVLRFKELKNEKEK